MDAPATPFKGLAPFEASDIDALLFFGRGRERELIVANLLASRLTVLYGPVGVGKSSLLRAGVAHRLRQEVGPDGRPDYAVVVFDAWSDDPWASLRTAIDAELAGRDARETDVLLLVDQTEEYFLYHEREEGPGTFAGELPGLVTDPSLRVSVLLAIREDALARLDRFKGSIPNLFSNYLRLDHLDREEARAAILGPVDRYNRLADEQVEVEDALVEGVLDQTAVGQVDFGSGGAGRVAAERGDQRIEAPYLQLVMRRLWDAERAEQSDTLRLATLDQLGGAEAIVRAHLERALADLNERERDLAASVFRHLVTPSGAKIAHAVDDLAEYADVDAGELRPVLTKLVEERILRPVAAVGAASDGVPHEIYHDVLGSAVLAWRARHRAERALEGERRRRRRAVRVAGLAIVTLAFVAAIAIFALTQRSQARAAARHAHARELDETALAQLASDPQRSLRLAVAAARLYPTQQAEDVLRRALIASHERVALYTSGPLTAATFSPNGRRILTASRDGKARILDSKTFRLLRVLRHDAAVTSASYRRDGDMILTASEDDTARLWDPQTGALLHTLHHGGFVLGAAFGPDELVVTASADHTARIWNGASGELLRVLRNPGPVYVAVLNVRGTLAATVAEDEAGHRQARIFDARTGRLLRVLPEKGVIDAVFSPDGKLLVTTSTDKTAHIWNAASGRLTHVLEHRGHVVSASFSPDGTELVTASEDGAAYVWAVATGTRLLLLIGPTGFVESASFSSDGRFIVISSTDRTARVYQADNGRELADLIGHTDAVTGASFSPDGRLIVTASADGTARIWDPGVEDQLQRLPFIPAAKSTVSAAFSPDGQLILVTEDRATYVWRASGYRAGIVRGAAGRFTGSSLSPDGRLAVTVSDDGTARIWRVASGQQIHVLRTGGRVGAASFSPDGRLVLTWSDDGTGRLWAVDSGRQLHVLRHGGVVTSGAFSPDGHVVVTAGTDGVAKVWNAESAVIVHELVGHRAPLRRALFSPDGKLVATVGDDGTARLWSASSGAIVHVLRGHTQALTDAEFTRDSRLVVTASLDNDARIWDVATGRLLHVLHGNFSAVNHASFSPDGRWVVTASRNVAILFRVDTGQLLFYLRGHGDRNALGLAAYLTNASFSPDGKRILTASEDGTVRIYDCEVCQGLKGLLSLARSRLSASGQ